MKLNFQTSIFILLSSGYTRYQLCENAAGVDRGATETGEAPEETMGNVLWADLSFYEESAGRDNWSLLLQGPHVPPPHLWSRDTLLQHTSAPLNCSKVSFVASALTRPKRVSCF